MWLKESQKFRKNQNQGVQEEQMVQDPPVQGSQAQNENLEQPQQQQPQVQVPPVAGQPHQVFGISEFMRLSPKVFKKSTAADDAESWLENAEKAFEAMNCNRNEDRVKYATYITLYRMHQEFTQLVLGDMTVDDYEVEFDRLARCVPSLVPDDEAKRNNFEFGLAMYLKKGIAGSTAPESYEDLVKRAKKLEVVHQEARAYAQANQKKRNREGENKGQARRDHPRVSKRPNLLPSKSLEESKEIMGAIRISQHRIDQMPLNVNVVERTTLLRLVGGILGLVSDVSRAAPVNSQGQQRNERPRVLARAYALTHQDAQAVGTVVSGTLPIAFSYSYVLFDSGATHSFVSSAFVTLHCLPTSPLDYDLCVSTPIGKEILTNRISKMCHVRIGNRELLAELILLEMSDFDVILGMEWLSTHYALVHCYKKVVNFEIPGEEKFCFEGSGAHSTPMVLSTMQACRLLRQGCKAFLASVVEANDNEMKIENIPVVREFPDAFPEDLPGLPPNREVEFSIDLTPGTAPISKAPYRMAPLEMKELKT
ncbi:uncharacterized protein LOC143861534 [Tasmannia lanceolata]|uniref:uncharacterized protein LOC143861534 n=1 Tax=Tasmannia lanceolata TaxID=3420 RepID=UPI004063232B